STGLLLSAAIAENRQKERSLVAINQRKDEFLAMLGHELRNPLAPVINSLTLLRAPGITAAQRAESLNIMERQLGQITRLVNDIVDASGMAHGKINLRKESITAQDAV